jgi:phosphoglycolate phosphatase
VIFDLDGTLADTHEDLADALNRTLQYEGLPTHDYAAVKRMVGNGMRQLVVEALPAQRRSDDFVAACFARFSADYAAHCLVKTRLYDDVEALIGVLHSGGTKLAICSNKDDQLTQRVVAALLGARGFTAIEGARAGMPLKPDPACPLLISQRLGLLPGEIVYVGDSRIDMRTAAAAGMIAVGVSWGFGAREDLTAAGAHTVLDRPLQLLDLRR